MFPPAARLAPVLVGRACSSPAYSRSHTVARASDEACKLLIAAAKCGRVTCHPQPPTLPPLSSWTLARDISRGLGFSLGPPFGCGVLYSQAPKQRSPPTLGTLASGLGDGGAAACQVSLLSWLSCHSAPSCLEAKSHQLLRGGWGTSLQLFL